MSFLHDGESEDRGDMDDGYMPSAVGVVRCVGETGSALKMRKGKGFKSTSFWVPKSVIHDDSEVRGEGDSGKLVVLAWYADKENL